MTKQKELAVRVLALFVAVFITAGTLVGCGGKNNDNSGGSNTATGRYVEQLLELGVSPDRVLEAFMDEDGGLVFYATDLNATGSKARQVTRWRLDPDGTLTSSYPQVLMDMSEASQSIIDISEAADGSLMILYIDGTYKLARSADGIGFDEIVIPGWYDFSAMFTGDGAFNAGGEDQGEDGPITQNPINTEQNPEGSDNPDEAEPSTSEQPQEGSFQAAASGGYSSNSSFGETMDAVLYPSGVIALENSFLMIYSMVGAKEYDYDGTLLREFDGQGKKSAIAVWGGKLAIVDLSGTEILVYDLATGKLLETVGLGTIGIDRSGTGIGGFAISLGGTVVLDMDNEGFIAGDTSGIYRYTDGEWVMAVDGELSTFIMSDRALVYLMAGQNDDYYAVLGEQKTEIMHYVYDASLSSQPETVLEIFSLHDNSTIRQAIGQFQRQNPNVKVRLRVAMDNENSATLEEVVRALNTELLAGKGPDLIVLDGLPFESYIEKGVLKDITGLANRLTDSGGLLANMAKTYEKDGKVYGMPSRFSVPIMLGYETELNAINSLSDLKDRVVEKQSGDPAYLRAESSNVWSTEGVLMQYYDACADMFMTADGGIDEAAMAEYLSNMLNIDGILKENIPESQAGFFMIAAMTSGGGGAEIIDMGANDIAEGKALVHLQKLVGVLGLMNISRCISEKDGMALTSMFNDLKYYPSGSVGILATSKQTELAESFLALLLSRSVQDKYLYDGFPVNGQSLQTMLTDELDFNGEHLDDMGFNQLCNTLDSPIFVNEIIKSAVQEQIYGLLNDQTTPEQAAKNVVDSTWLYLAE